MFQWLTLAFFRMALGLFTGKCLALNLVAIPTLRSMDNPAKAFKVLFQNNLPLCMCLILISVFSGIANWHLTGDKLVLFCVCLHALCFPIGIKLQPDIEKYVDIEDYVPTAVQNVVNQVQQGNVDANHQQQLQEEQSQSGNGTASRMPDIGLPQVRKDIESWATAHWIEAAFGGCALFLSVCCLPGQP